MGVWKISYVFKKNLFYIHIEYLPYFCWKSIVLSTWTFIWFYKLSGAVELFAEVNGIHGYNSWFSQYAIPCWPVLFEIHNNPWNYMIQCSMGLKTFWDLPSIWILEWGFWMLLNNVHAWKFSYQTVKRTKMEILSAEKLTV